MAAGVNKVILVGNLGQDPELRHTGGGTPVVNMRLAVTERAKAKSGEWEDRTEWVNVVAFGKTAENCGQYLQKGRQIYVEGRLQTRNWEDKEGNKRYTTEVIGNQVLFLGNKEGGKAGGVAKEGAPDEPPPINDEDLPF